MNELQITRKIGANVVNKNILTNKLQNAHLTVLLENFAKSDLINWSSFFTTSRAPHLDCEEAQSLQRMPMHINNF